jgi:hypothetical protein
MEKRLNNTMASIGFWKTKNKEKNILGNVQIVLALFQAENPNSYFPVDVFTSAGTGNNPACISFPIASLVRHTGS